APPGASGTRRPTPAWNAYMSASRRPTSARRGSSGPRASSTTSARIGRPLQGVELVDEPVEAVERLEVEALQVERPPERGLDLEEEVDQAERVDEAGAEDVEVPVDAPGSEPEPGRARLERRDDRVSDLVAAG